MRTSKYASLAVSIGIALLISGISGCLPGPYCVGEPDSLFSEYHLMWDMVNSHYACFFAKEDVDWDQSLQTYKSAAENLKNETELFDLCLELMGELEDQNLSIRNSVGTRLESWNQGAFVNWTYEVWRRYIESYSPDTVVVFHAYGAITFKPTNYDTLGYMYISDLGDGYGISSFYNMTYVIKDCRGLILDLRMCSESGSAYNAYTACGRFIKVRELGYYEVFRTGPGRNDMGEMRGVLASRNASWQYTEPIVLLTGRGTQGAAEQLVLLLRTQQHVTVIGDTTAGFANPAVSFNLTNGCTIEIPEMVTYSPDTTLILNSGIAPDIFIPVSEADLEAGVDPVFDAALGIITQ
ncbi:MAG: hypothetical protein K8S15_01050 [Candidatus Aegiribacteria sp.]|nr:hypothetical protein [Candidatus Aegiribacteria sp.]